MVPSSTPFTSGHVTFLYFPKDPDTKSKNSEVKRCYHTLEMFQAGAAIRKVFCPSRRSATRLTSYGYLRNCILCINLILCLVSCSASNASLFIDLEEIRADLVFVFVSDKSGSDFELLSDTPRILAELGDEPLLKFESDTPSDIILILGLTQEEITEIEPLVDLDQLNQSQLKRTSSNHTTARDVSVAALPLSAFVKQVSRAIGKITPIEEQLRDALLSDYEIHLPIDLDRCRNEKREKIETFYDPPKDCRRDYLDILPYGDQKFVAISSRDARIFDINEAPSCEEAVNTSTSATQSIINLPNNNGNAAVGMKQAPDGSRLFVSVSEFDDGGPTASSVILERRLYANGFSAVTSSQSFSKTNAGFLSFDGEVDQVIIDQDDRVYVLYESGLIATKPTNDDDYTLTEISQLTNNVEDRGKKHFQITTNQQTPHLVTRTNHLYYGDLDEDSWSTTELSLLSQDIRPWDTALDSDGSIYIAANDNGKGWVIEHNKQANTLEELRIRYPSRIAGCFVDQRPEKARRVLNTRNAIYVLTSCNMLIRIRKSDRCQSFFHLEDDNVLEFSRDFLRGLTILGNELYTTNRNGKIHRVNLEGFDSDLESLSSD